MAVKNTVPITALTRYEKIASIQLATKNQSYTLPTQGGQLPSDRFIHSLRLTFEGRYTNPSTNNPTALLADDLPALIERIVVEGYHRSRGMRERFIDIRGADLYRLNAIYHSLAPLCTPALAGYVLTADEANDIRFILDLPFVPERLPAYAQTGWLLDAPNYDALTLTIEYADENNFAVCPAAIPATAFGSATGNPVLHVDAMYAMAGPSRFRGFLPGRVWRHYAEVTGSLMTTTATDVRLFNIPRGNRIRAMLLKSGTKATGVTAGNNSYATHVNTALDEIVIYRGINRINRHYRSYEQLMEETVPRYGYRPPDGYGLIDWAANGLDREVLDARGLIAGPTGDVDLYLGADVTGAANKAALALYEEWRGFPANIIRG